MKRTRTLVMSAASLILAAVTLMCIGPTPTPQNPDTSPPRNINTQTVNNVAGDTISVQCQNFGNEYVSASVQFQPNSFNKTQETFTISCITDSDAQYLDRLVKQETGATNVALGAITLEPSPYDFTKYPFITIPLFNPRPELANTTQDIYFYAPDLAPKLQKLAKGLVDSQGLTASGQVEHFTTFVLVAIQTPTAEPVIPTTPPTVTVPPPTVTPIACTDPLGCVIYRPGEPIRLATLLAYGAGSLTASVAKNSSDGVYHAVNEMGNMYGHPIDIATFDEACNPNVAANSANQIVSDPSFIGVIGTTCSASADAAMKYFLARGYTMISPTNTRISLTQRGSHINGYFRVAPPDSVEAQPMANYASKQNWNYVVIIFDASNTYFSSMAELFSQAVPKVGGKVIAQYKIEQQTTDFSSILSDISYNYYYNKPDAIYLSMTPPQASSFISQMRHYELYSRILGSSALRDPVLFYRSGDYANSPYGVGYGTYITDISPSVTGNAADYGHDAAAILLSAVQNTAKVLEDGTLVIGRQALREALQATYGYRGYTGTLTCNSYGDCANPKVAVYWYNYKRGKFVEVYVKYP